MLPQTREAAETGRIDAAFFRDLGTAHGIRQIVLTPQKGVAMLLYQQFEKPNSTLLRAATDVLDGNQKLGVVTVLAALTGQPTASEDAIQRFIEEQRQLAGRKKFYHDTYFLLICLLTLFVLFFAAWSAQILSRQISVPISALLGAAQEVRRGNLSYRVRVNAMDELATLVRAFNEMTNELEGNARELEARRRFTEAILESIPTGVISVSADERIERVNRALSGIFPREVASSPKQLRDLFSGEDLAEVRYLLKRARRSGTAACQLEIQRSSAVLHLAVTVASLEEQRGFVLVLEDTSDLLRAQKAAAWQAEARAILEECTGTIQQEVQTVKSLVNEFSQFSRFPTAQPVAADLNEIVESALGLVTGRLDGIGLSVHLDRKIPLVYADREQMKRVIVNLVENAAEAMREAPVQRLLVATSQSSPDSIELSVTDTGAGISAADKERLFLPYFSTKSRGTGLGLAIVSHIITEHHGRVRVEDNYPVGARFIIELNAFATESTAAAEKGDLRAATVKV